jgi:hypothetical protein
MGYQYIENLKNARELIIREYEDTNPIQLPDERYQIRLKYYDAEQLEKEQGAYDAQMEAFKNEIQHLWDVTEAVYVRGKSGFKVNDYDDLAKQMRTTVKKLKEQTTDPLYEEITKVWNEISLIKAEDTDVEKLNQTYLYEKDLFKKMMIRTREKIGRIFGFQNPHTRVLLDERLNFLQREFEAFDYMINPYHVQPGLVLDVDISSIKRKKFTLYGMANVLNEFLHGVSKGFQDAAFATFKRRRSTVREDIGMSFGSDMTADWAAESAGGEEGAADAGVKGKADVTPSRKKSSSDELQEL